MTDDLAELVGDADHEEQARILLEVAAEASEADAEQVDEPLLEEEEG